ncbi:MarR family winged helix-turn-helix transcriptional regulator [Umezawaea endophytica]|uniref:MarR family transcriptional regulator n=1 Tax=Umezawaea endophytica TaxID=1654476 RepID=A0A9X2VII1_9PSEU|nr:MarR family transcriptional regulator [Umezawaea endophytica]MCS7477335.1 MarR family transcriptional regulator [Umezawaea endophytica]
MRADDRAPARLRTMPSWLVAQVAAVGERLVGERLAAVGARRYHYRVLAALAEFGPASQAGVARSSGVHGSDVVAVVNELVEQGFASRVTDPDDRRRHVVAVTDDGVAKLEELDAVLAEAQDELLDRLSAQDRAELVRLLGRVLLGS